MSREDTNDIAKIATGVFIGKYAYDNQDELAESVTAFVILYIIANFIGMMYWAATDFPAFWAFTSTALIDIATGVWRLISTAVVWLWGKYRDMYLVVQILVGLYFLGLIISPWIDIREERPWGENEQIRRNNGLVSLAQADRVRKAKYRSPPPNPSRESHENAGPIQKIIPFILKWTVYLVFSIVVVLILVAMTETR